MNRVTDGTLGGVHGRDRWAGRGPGLGAGAGERGERGHLARQSCCFEDRVEEGDVAVEGRAQA